jgi:hypothetical protein
MKIFKIFKKKQQIVEESKTIEELFNPLHDPYLDNFLDIYARAYIAHNPPYICEEDEKLPMVNYSLGGI